MSEPIIVNRGRGPEIRGTRITVYDVMDYYNDGWQAPQISAVFQLPVDWIEAAIEYIESHREEVDREYKQIIDRHEKYEYPPEVSAKLESSRTRFKAFVTEVRQRKQEAESEYARNHVG
jgi:uncharacterized protein (DUF433 family)